MAIAKFGRAITIEREIKQRNYTNKEAKMIRSNNLTRSKREMFNIDITILKKNNN